MRQPGKTAAPGERVAMWDGAVRLVHLGFILLIPALWWSWKSGDMDLHKRLGIVMLGLVFFRILWGLMGSSTARFARFVRGPAAILAYLRGRTGGEDKEPVEIGHNPLGGWSVIAMLSLLALQLGLGLIAQDVDGLESGPLNHLVSYETAEAARDAHGLVFNLILALIALHICAVLFHALVKRDALIGPMITGSRRFKHRVKQPGFASPARLILGVAAAAACAWWISAGAPLPSPPAMN